MIIFWTLTCLLLVSLPQVAAGMYLLRLTSNKQVRVQKMVIK